MPEQCFRLQGLQMNCPMTQTQWYAGASSSWLIFLSNVVCSDLALVGNQPWWEY